MNSKTESYSSKYLLKIAIQLIVIATVLVVFSGKVSAEQKNDYPMPLEEMLNLSPEPTVVKPQTTRKKKPLKKKRVTDKNIRQSQENTIPYNDKYNSQIRSKITRNWRKPAGVEKELTTTLRIKIFPQGAVADVTVIRSSGNLLYDRSAQDAVKRASPLPVPRGSAFDKFRSMTFKFSPTGIR